ncbi:MAG: alanine racemase [Parcubacteria group bacterium]|nr:alanine racemase [Parcubacteria group bacterium]
MLNINDHKTWVEVNKKNLINNLGQFRKLIGVNRQLMAVVKSNAYGHGLVEVAQIASENGANWLGVDSIDEALELKKNGIELPILILGYTLKSRLSEVAENDFRQVVYNKETIEELGKFKNKVNVHIKVETGTSRQGVLKEKILNFVEFTKTFENINIEGISTHFANIEDTTDHSYAKGQLDKYKEIVKSLEENGVEIPIKHTACSAAAVLFPETYFDMVRLGISMYGHWSSKETYVSSKEQKGDVELLPVLTWKARVAQVKTIKAGTPVSYGITEKVSQDTKIAILPIGYWDGFDRGLSSVGSVLIGGKKCKILGRVCMNMIVVDVNHVENVMPEDEVVIIGRQGSEEITAEEMASKLGTINYEVLTRINPRILRVVK